MREKVRARLKNWYTNNFEMWHMSILIFFQLNFQACTALPEAYRGGSTIFTELYKAILMGLYSLLNA